MNKKFLLFLFCFVCGFGIACSNEVLKDSFVDESLLNVETIRPEPVLNYDFSDTDIVKIPLRITETITTSLKNKSYEGQQIKFLVDSDVYYKNKILVKKGTCVNARLEIITTRGFAGIPAEIFITDFKIPGLDSNKIMEPVSKRGFSTTTLILPVKWILTPFPPLGSITNLAVGFNTTLTPNQLLYVDYYPNF